MLVLTLFVSTQLGREVTRKTSTDATAAQDDNRDVQIAEEVHRTVLSLLFAPLFVDAAGVDNYQVQSDSRVNC